MAIPIPANESLRLRVLERHSILDTAPEAAFDDLARLASQICGTPMAAITLIDAERQWLKSAVGPLGRDGAREHSFCTHALDHSDLLIVEDAAADDRFADNPSVLGPPGIRFYAGAPLTVAEGVTFGTLCVIDSRPRQLDPAQLDALRVLRRAVIAQLELRRALHDLADAGRLLPMCAWCRDVRRDDGSWLSLHEFVMRTGQVTHGMCPACAESFAAG